MSSPADIDLVPELALEENDDMTKRYDLLAKLPQPKVRVATIRLYQSVKKILSILAITKNSK